jgi:hypothetical protein
LELSQFAKKIIDSGTGRARSAGLAIRLTEPDSTPIFSTARTLWPVGFTDVDFGLGVSLADEAAARSRVSQLSP